ncbi:phage major capsid protein [Bordetella bronchiseptica]|uniref:phage major capsid protein n=1 Tax=Bordetella bronchiseptica TaxID=518 RepID=UPI000461BA84|nr:phage major capsid protein [Bordetella bronchiseptica]KDD10024.1 phage major capsid protein, HK97 family [Bordetella bronchiseptica MBORD707]VEI25165.1 Predicted phage phi-C31 gp36 major capsid-like protein [Bordetella bronchiseptica]
MKIHELRSERARINDQVQALATVEAESGQLTAEQQQEFATLSAKFSDLTAQIDRAESAERMAAAAAVPVQTPAQVVQAGSTGAPAQPRTPEVPGAKMARMVRALAAARGDNQKAAQLALDRGYGEDVAASLNILDPTAGGVLVPANLSSEVIELLRPKTVVRKLGTRTLPLENGNLTLPRLKGGATVGYIGSDSDAPVTGQQFDDLKLTSKKMAALVPISNDLLSYAGVNPNVDRVVVEDLTNAVSAREDKAFIRDNGTANMPKGLRFWAIPANVLVAPDLSAAADAIALLRLVDQALGKMILLLEMADANMVTPGWIMSPRTFRFLEGLRDGNGNKVYPELAAGNLKGYPVGRTTQVPSNLGAGGDESEIYFADFNDCFIGEDETLVIDYSKEATYKDGNGDVISAFQRDQTLIRVIAKHDFGPRHVESVAVMDKVTWGA